MKMTSAIAAAAAAFVLMGAASAASAQDVAFNIAGTSDYVFRGFSQTDEDPAISGGVDVTSGSFYAGAWASNVEFGDSTDAEIDVYGGYRTEAAGLALDVGVVGYLYTGEPSGADYDYVEVKAAASRAVGPLTVGGAVFYSPDFFGADDEAVYAELNAAFSPADKLTLSGAVGNQWLDVNDDYLTWNAGASLALTDNVALDLRYHDTDTSGISIADSRLVGTIKLLF